MIGICARLDNKHDDLMSQLPTLPAWLLIAVGAVGSFVGFIGFLGAVRESFCLLKMVKICTNLNNVNDKLKLPFFVVSTLMLLVWHQVQVHDSKTKHNHWVFRPVFP